MRPEDLTVSSLAPEIAKGEIRPTDLVDGLLNRIKRLDPKLNAFITVTDGAARQRARDLEAMLRTGRLLGPLHGIPIAVKDIIDVAGARCTMGSKIFADHIPREDATVVARLREAGAIIIGKTNLHEFASGTTNVNPHYGPCRNPWDLERISGGSSGGSAVAVACGMGVASLGTDTSGSIRIPAALCGTVGLKPTFGRVSKQGVFPLSPSLDHVGPIARTSMDCAHLLQRMAGHDPIDDYSADEAVPNFVERMDEAKMRLGVPRDYFLDLLDEDVEKVFWRFVKKMESIGFAVREVRLESAELIRDAWAPIRRAEASAVHEELVKRHSSQYGTDVLRMLQDGTRYTAVQYIKAQDYRRIVLADLQRILKDDDALLCPATPIPAPKIGSEEVEIRGEVLDVYSTLVRLTIPFNVTGLPAVTVPAGFSREGLPIGVQIAGRPFEEGRILGVAHLYEQAEGTLAKFTPEIARG